MANQIINKRKLVSCSCEYICKAIERYIAKANDDLLKALKKAGYVDASFTVKQAEKLESELTDILQGKTDKFIELLESNPDDTIDDIIEKLPEFNSNTNITDELTDVFRRQFSSSVSHIANAYVKSIDKELKLQTMTKRTSSWITSWSSELADIMNVNTEDKLQSILSRGLQEGKSVSKVARELVESGTLDSATRARTTALTEMLRANSVSAQEAYIQSPAVSNKKWRHTGARKTVPRENHIDMDGQIVPVSEPFDLTGADGSKYYPMYPRDIILPAGESINCHCIHQPIVDDDIFGMSLKEREKLQGHRINTDNKAWKEEQKAIGRENKKNYQKTLANRRKSGKINTGAISGALNPYSKRAEEHAVRYYKSVRKMKTDTKRISKATGIKRDKLDKIKNHIFVDKHKLSNGTRRFDPSYDMAQSWQRLISGNYEEKDMILLKHEYAELRLMEKGFSQNDAHIRASKRYNYADYCD